LNYKEMTRQFDFEVQARAAARAASAGTEDKAAWEKIGQVAQQLYARGASLVESFAPYDRNRDGYLDQQEFHQFLSTCDPNVQVRESNAVFARVAAPLGRIDAHQFGK
ncbi:unnamed protein product, partial [Polarella glacialis]